MSIFHKNIALLAQFVILKMYITSVTILLAWVWILLKVKQYYCVLFRVLIMLDASQFIEFFSF